MPTKKTKQTKTDQKNELTEEQAKLADQIFDFFQLSRDILSSTAPEYINQLDDDWKFKASAKLIAEELNLDWENMSYEENSILMLNLLLEYWADIEDKKSLKPVLRVVYEPKK